MQTTSVTIEWHNWGLCCGDDMVLEKTTVSKASSTIHIKQYNGHRGILLDERVAVNLGALQEFFEFIDRIAEAEQWTVDYSVDVCDGFMWNMYIRQGRTRRIKLHGTVEPPPYGEEIERRIRHMLLEANALVNPELFCALQCEEA